MNSEKESPRTPSRGVLTIAFGHTSYVGMAKSLGQSLKLHAPSLPTAIVTDSLDPELRQFFTHIIPYRSEFGSDVRQKLYLPQYSPFEETLFIDSDSLVLTNLDSFWKAFEGKYFGVPGWRALRKGEQDPYVEVDFILEHFALDKLPKFNGGAYYFTRSAETNRFFETVQQILVDYKALRFPDFRRDGPNDEAIFAVAMALHGLSATSMGCRGMWTPISSPGPMQLDVLAGSCRFEKEGRMVLPDVVHFAGGYSSCYAYMREREKLRVHMQGGWISPFTWIALYVRGASWDGWRKLRTKLKPFLRMDRRRHAAASAAEASDPT